MSDLFGNTAAPTRDNHNTKDLQDHKLIAGLKKSESREFDVCKHGKHIHHKHSGDRRHHSGDRTHHSGDRRQHSGDRRHHSGDRRHHSGDRRSHSGDRRHHSGDRRSYSGDRRHHSGDRRQHSGDRRHHSGDRKHFHSGDKFRTKKLSGDRHGAGKAMIGNSRTDLEVAATVNLAQTPASSTPVSSTSSSLGAVADKVLSMIRDHDASAHPDVPKPETPTARISLGSLDRIRTDLHKLGVRTSNHVTLSHRINVFDDRSWEEYGKSGDVLVFDLVQGSRHDVRCTLQQQTLHCEELTEPLHATYPWRGRGRFNAEWSIPDTTKRKDIMPTRLSQIGKFEGGLHVRRFQNTKTFSSHPDRYTAFKVDERTTDPKVQELIMSMGDTPDTAMDIRNGKPDFYAEVDELHGYLEKYKEEQPGDLLRTPPTNPYFDQQENEMGTSDEEIATRKSHHDFEVDPQTCWPCVGCQDDDVPKTMRWCSVM